MGGEALHEATFGKGQVMMSVVGLEKTKLEPICKEAAKMEGESGVCDIALQLFPGGITVGGTGKACGFCEEKAVKAGAQMAKVIGDTAYHTALIQPALDKLEGDFKDLVTKLKPLKHSVWQNATAEPVRPGTDPNEIVDNLRKQMTKCVLYEAMCKEAIKELKDPNMQLFEVGPGKQLKQMMKRIDQNAWKNMENYEC